MRRLIILLLLGAAAAQAQQTAGSNGPGPWAMQHSGTTANLRGIHAIGAGVAWASGANGTVLRTEDSGYMWQNCAMPPGAENLDFRGIWAWDANTAIAMSSGPGDQSRLYKTIDGCSHWTLLYTNPDKDGFWDAVEFWDKDTGYILGDPVNGRFVLLSTEDGGRAWQRENSESLRSSAGESIFAASNSSLSMDAMDPCYFGTGGAGGTRVYVGLPDENDPSRSVWHGILVPLASGNDSSGVFSIDFREAHYPDDGRPVKIKPRVPIRIVQHGIAVGGDYKKPDDPAGTAAWTADAGKTWTAAGKAPHGYRSAVAFDAEHKAWITVGTNGTDVSYDDGKTWSPLDSGNWNALGLPWVVGPGGRIAKLVSLEAATRLH